MEVTNDMPEENTGLTQGDLAIAAFALAETFNAYLERYNEEDFGDLSKDQMESSMGSLRLAFAKFDAILQAMNPEQEEVQ
tara:strand:+ start:1268 stop:1507 length:240 start_codon:yes stop_codon:yes gene_type:complete